jgi:hypothetical protein
MPESNEQGLVERLRERVPALSSVPVVANRSLLRDAADALEAQSAQIAELQAEVDRLREGEARLSLQLNDTAREASTQIADLKRALDTARHDAMEEAAKVAERHDLMPCGHAPGWDEDQKLHYDCGQVDACSSVAAAIRALQTKDQSHGA